MSYFGKTLFGLLSEGEVKVYRKKPHKVQGTVLAKRAAGSVYFVTFDLQNGKQQEMCVTESEYSMFELNQLCELSFDGSHCTNIKLI